jgi:acyl-lipid omega-6 desaturase (Delta-12 desaturase)
MGTSLACYKPDNFRSAFQVSTTLLLYAALWSVLIATLDRSIYFGLASSIAIGICSVRLFNLQHDCAHRSYFTVPSANDWLGAFLGITTLTPHYYWSRHHLRHHATSGNLDHRGHGDIMTWTSEEFVRASFAGRLLYRAYRNPFVFLLFGSLFYFCVKLRLPTATRSFRELWSAIFVDLVWIAAYASAAHFGLDWRKLLVLHLVSVLVGGSLGLWLFFAQHQFEGTFWSRSRDWTFRAAAFAGSSYLVLPRWLEAFFVRINLHHVHHAHPYVPNYLLRKKMKELELGGIGSKPISVAQSVSAFKLKVWDENARRLVGFPKGRS